MRVLLNPWKALPVQVQASITRFQPGSWRAGWVDPSWSWATPARLPHLPLPRVAFRPMGVFCPLRDLSWAGRCLLLSRVRVSGVNNCILLRQSTPASHLTSS